jgi:hypothetical protein
MARPLVEILLLVAQNLGARDLIRLCDMIPKLNRY